MSVVQLTTVKNKLTFNDLVSQANAEKLQDVAIIGYDHRGDLHIISNFSSYPELLYLLRNADETVYEESK